MTTIYYFNIADHSRLLYRQLLYVGTLYALMFVTNNIARDISSLTHVIDRHTPMVISCFCTIRFTFIILYLPTMFLNEFMYYYSRSSRKHRGTADRSK